MFDVLILNTAVVDFRGREFAFTEKLAGAGGLARCQTQDMPAYTQRQYKRWIASGCATAGGPGNTAPLLARAGFNVAVGVCLGKGEEGGMDVPGRFFYYTMIQNGVDMSQVHIHPTLPTGTTYIYEKDDQERGGIAYFPNANNDFDFAIFQKSVEKLNPTLVYYMYSGLSDRGDANDGQDLAAFMAWCRRQGCLTIADSHTLTGNPHQVIEAKIEVPHYHLLEPLLPELDLFFTSYDEARMIENTLGEKGHYLAMSESEYIVYFLTFLADRFWRQNRQAKLFGVTVQDGAFVMYRDAAGNLTAPVKISSRFMCGSVVDLVGAGDSFRAGVAAYLCRQAKAFKTSRIDIEQAVQMGNLFASLYIKSPLNRRYDNIGAYRNMLRIVESRAVFDDFDQLTAAVKGGSESK
jgi:sugar/nucleoside kinase (ribokinase family)